MISDVLIGRSGFMIIYSSFGLVRSIRPTELNNKVGGDVIIISYMLLLNQHNNAAEPPHCPSVGLTRRDFSRLDKYRFT